MSRSATLAQALVDAVAGWDQLPTGVDVQRVRSVTAAAVNLPAATPGLIAVIVPSVDDTSNRAEVAETLTVAIVVIGACDSEAATDSDAWDDFTELLRDWIRTDRTFRAVTLTGNIAAQRQQVSTPIVCDANRLDESEIFISVTETTWHIAVGNRA